tara:strand:+ start:8595 stop:8870 length:276 start_codon:yes stop_codon:yes gene_type:complete
MKEEKEDNRKPWQIRYNEIVRSRLTEAKKNRRGAIRKTKAGHLTGNTKQENVSTRKKNCIMCGIRKHVRDMHITETVLHYCQKCAKSRGLI